MSELCAIRFDSEAQNFRVSGELSLDSVTAVMNETADLFEQAAEIDIDLVDVVRSDSAGLALLIEWMRQAQQKEKIIRFHNLPKQMMAIAKATGVDAFLPVH